MNTVLTEEVLDILKKVETPIGLLWRRDSPIPEQLQQAFTEGAVIQFYDGNGIWEKVSHPGWYNSCTYRVDPNWKPKVVPDTEPKAAPDTELEEQRTALVRSIAHWSRMIAWAEKQNPAGISSEHAMRTVISEAWFANDCALCELCARKVGIFKKCDICILAKQYRRCCEHPTENRASWCSVHWSETWGAWVTQARMFQAAMIDVLAKSYK